MRLPLDYRDPTTLGGEQEVVVLRRPDGSVEVGAHYRKQSRLLGTPVCGVFIALGLGFPFGMFFIGDHAVSAVIVGLAFGAFMASLALGTLRYIWSTHRFVATRAGLLVEQTTPRGRVLRRFIPRGEIEDVQITSGRRGKDNTAVLLRRTQWWRLSPHLLMNMSADLTAKAADGIREGLGMPEADWSGGRVRKAAQVTPSCTR